MTIALSRATGANVRRDQGRTEEHILLVLSVTYVYGAAKVLLAYPDLGLLRCAWVHWSGGSRGPYLGGTWRFRYPRVLVGTTPSGM
jgi:hypothetical protein